MMPLRVWGLDPASSKTTMVFNPHSRDGNHGFERWTRAALEERLPGPNTSKHGHSGKTTFGPRDLLCWDAPLTGPPNLEDESYEGDLCTRIIEKRFGGGIVTWADKRKPRQWHPDKWNKTPPGISVRGYAGLSHWTLSRRVLGLPRVGPYDCPPNVLPARLLSSQSTTPPPMDAERPSVVEVHPGLALWLWLRPEDRYCFVPDSGKNHKVIEKWRYKDHPYVRKQIWSALRAHLQTLEGELTALKTGRECMDALVASNTSFSDDHLDAFIAWALGTLWVQQDAGSPKVMLFGDERVGAMLLPCDGLLGEDLGGEFKAEQMRRNREG